jgi:hypothetical protein
MSYGFRISQGFQMVDMLVIIAAIARYDQKIGMNDITIFWYLIFGL